MYIKSIELINFKAHRNTKINFEDVNVIVGANAKGKTSILDGISYALYGVTADGATKKELLTNVNYIKLTEGEKAPTKGKVVLTFDNGFVLTRSLGSSVELKDDEGKIITDKATEIETWLNIPREMFMTLIYGIQGKMTDAFLKFNATQKDFIDNLFEINNYMDPINAKLVTVSRQLDCEYNTLLSLKNNKKNCEDYYDESLLRLHCLTIEELYDKILETEKQISLFGDIEKVSQTKQEQSSLKAKIEYSKNNKTNLENDLINLENNIQPLQVKFNEAANLIQQSLNIEITPVMNDSIIRDIINKNCNINSWYDNLHNILENINETNLNEMKQNGIQILNYIRQIDQYRNYYLQLLSNWNNLKMQISNNNKNIENVKINIEQLTAGLNILTDQLNILNESLSTIGAEGEGNNISIYKNLVSNYSMMKSQYEALSNYKKQLSQISFDENKLNEIVAMKEKLQCISEIFKREGFPQFIRTVYVKDIAAMMNDMLMEFGFNSLLPVTVTEAGEFLYNGVKMKSISGAQKICASIIQKFIYGRILAPGMKLGIMILDEPTYGMDAARVDYLKEFLTVLNRNLGLQLIIVTHKKEIIPEDAHVIELS